MASVLTPSRKTGWPRNVGVPRDLIMPLSVDQYHRMIDADILDEDDPVELLDGFPGDTSLIIEVADSTLDRDRGWKKGVYAQPGYPFIGSSISSKIRLKCIPD